MAVSVVTSLGEVATGNIKNVRLDLSFEDELTTGQGHCVCQLLILNFPLRHKSQRGLCFKQVNITQKIKLHSQGKLYRFHCCCCPHLQL